MGQATINSGGPTGLYNVKIAKDAGKSVARQTAITTRLAALVGLITTATTNVNTALSELASAQTALDAAIAAMVDATTRKVVTDATATVLTKQQAVTRARMIYAGLIVEQQSLQKEQARLATAMEDESISAWCADLTENLATGATVGTAEINGEDDHLIILPGGSTANALGKLQHSGVSTGAGVFYNKAILPCWQKWKPTYRIGTISSINYTANTCSLTLDAALSMEQSLDINQTATLTGVPIEYMAGLNAEPFVTGDRVVVAFTGQSWATPKVIGFESNPRTTTDTGGNYYLFYLDGGSLKIANCSWETAIDIKETRTKKQVFVEHTAGSVNKITYFCKRFPFLVNGTLQDLYLVATNLFIQSAPFTGWTAFAAANPSHPLVTNKSNSKITWTAQVLTDLNAVNKQVNDDHVYVPEYGGSDNWKILGTGEAGDCEDIALTKAQALLDLGYSASALHIECGLSKTLVRGDGYPQGHAWLVVQTTAGDYALDLGRDNAVVNASLKYPGTAEDYIARRRQIGSNWAFISSFGWMEVSTLTTPGTAQSSVSYYILDPVLNIFHRMQSSAFGDSQFAGWAGATPFAGAEQQYTNYPDYLGINRSFFGVNFSNSKIYLSRSYGPEYETHLDTYSFDGYECSLDSTSIETGKGLVDIDGSFIEINSDGGVHAPSVKSSNGYFDINSVLVASPFKLNLILSKTDSNKFEQNGFTSGNYSMPDGSSIGFTGGTRQANFWTQIDTDTLLMQAVVIDWGTAELKYCAYKNNVDCLSTMKAAVSVTNDNDFLGIAYVPGTNRLR